MISQESLEAARRGEQIYEQRLRASLEKSHWGQFVAIEPDSGEHVLAKTLEEAAAKAQQAHPGKRSYLCRIGFQAAVEFGCAQQ